MVGMCKFFLDCCSSSVLPGYARSSFSLILGGLSFGGNQAGRLLPFLTSPVCSVAQRCLRCVSYGNCGHFKECEFQTHISCSVTSTVEVGPKSVHWDLLSTALKDSCMSALTAL